MAVCSLGAKELLSKAISNDVQNDPRTKGLVEGQTYDVDDKILSGLREIGSKYGSSLYRVGSGGSTFTFFINIPQEVVDSYEQSSKGNPRTSWQKSNRNESSLITTEKIAIGLKERISIESEKLNDFADSVMLSAKRLSSAVFGSNPEFKDASLQESMSQVWTALQQDPDANAKIRLVSQYIAEAKEFMAVMRKRVEALDLDDTTDDGTFLHINEIEKLVDMYAPMITEFEKFLASAPLGNPVRTVIDEAATDLKAIKNRISAFQKQTVMAELLDLYQPKLEKARAELEAQIRTLESKKKGASKRQIAAIEKKIAQIQAEFDAMAPTKENVEATLIGKAADSSWLDKYVLAGAMNADLLVQGFMRKVKNAYQNAQLKFQEKGAQIGERWKALVDSGFGTGNIEKDFKDLYEEVTEYFYNEETGEVEEGKVLYFVSEVSEQWRTEFTKMKSELTKLGREIQNKRREGATQEELSPLESEYDRKKTEYIKWRRENFETEYDERYQQTDAILDTVVTYGGRLTTLREIRSGFYDSISRTQEEAMALTGVPSEDSLKEIERLRREFEAVKSPLNPDGTNKTGEDKRISDLFTQHAAEMREMTDRWEVTQSSMDRFNTRKAEIDAKYEAGEITKEERDRWYASNTTTVYNPKYWSERKNTVETLNALAEQIQAITGNKTERSLKESYERMEQVCKKYRDHNSHIDGRMLNRSEMEAIKSLEEEIESVKQATRAAYSGFLGEDFQMEYDSLVEQRNQLAERIKQLRKDDPTNSQTTKNEVAEIRKKLKELRSNEKKLAEQYLLKKGTSKEDVKTFLDLYDKYSAAIKYLSSLTESVETQAYYDTYQKELNKFVAGKSEAERSAKIARTNKITIGNTKYQKRNGFFYELNLDGTLNEENSLSPEEVLDHIFAKDFKSSQWYLDNHFEAERYDSSSGEMVRKFIPIYSWRISQPSDKRWITEHAPNISWKRRVIKDEYRNPNAGLSLDGLPNIKKGTRPNTNYESLRASNPKLWEFRDFMIDEFLKAQLNYPPGKALGMRVPTIERNSSLYDNFQRKFQGTGTQISRQFNLNAQDVDEGLFKFSDASGYEAKFIPIKFQGRLEADLVSRNIIETVGQYAGQAELWKARNELLNFGKALETTLDYQAHTPSSDTIDKSAKILGVFRRNKKRGENERLDTIRNMINMFVYGESMAEQTIQGKKLHKWLSNLLGMRAGLLFSEITNIIGPGTMFSTGWAQLVNWIGGTSQQIIRTSMASSPTGFKLSSFLWAKKEYLANATSFINDIGKVSNRSFWTEFADFFDVQEGAYIDEFGKQLYSRGIMRQFNFNNLAFFKNAVEHELMMTSVMAFADSYHIDTPDGKISLRDAFTVEGGRLIPKYPISEAELSDIRGYIANMLREINGNYGKLDKVHAEQWAILKSMFFMRKWLIPMVVARYGGKKFSVEQDRVTQGYIWESIQIGWKAIRGFNDTGFQGIGALILPDLGVTLTDREKDSLRKTRTEVALVIFMWLMYRAVLGYDDEDPERFKKLEKESAWIQGLTYSFRKANSEQSTFLPLLGIDEGKKIAQNLLGNTAPFVGDMWNIISEDINWSINPADIEWERYKRDSGIHEKGDLKAAAHFWKMLGLTSAKESPVEALRTFEYSLNK